jgi:hypothetical protein
VPHHADAGEPGGVRLLPVGEQVVEHREEPLVGRGPGLHQVVVETDLVDRRDGRVGVRVGGEQHELRVGRRLARPLEELDAGHLRHAVVGQDERHRLIPQGELVEDAERFGTGVGPHDLVVGGVPAAQVARDRLRHRRVVVNGQDDRPRHSCSRPPRDPDRPRRRWPQCDRI